MTSNRWTVGFDGTAEALHAAEWAAVHAPGRSASITLLHAERPSTPIPATHRPREQNGTPPATLASLPDVAAADLAGLFGARIATATRPGDETNVLLDATENSDLLVVGSRNIGRIERIMVGSTSVRCATHAGVATVVVPRPRRAQPLKPATDIVVAVDGSANSIEALRWTCRFAEPGSHVTAMMVWEFTPSLYSGETLYLPKAIANARQRLEETLEVSSDACRAADITIHDEFVHGRPRQVIAGRATSADLLVVGRRGRGAIGATLLGSVSTWLLHNAASPIVVVPPPRLQRTGQTTGDLQTSSTANGERQ